MNYTILFFELSLELKTKEFKKQLDKAYKNAEKTDSRMYPAGFDHVDETYLSNGIGIRYYDGKHKKLRLVIYPGLVIGDDLAELWKPNGKNIDRLREELNEFIAAYLHSGYSLNDFALTRIEYAVDVNVGNKVADYIKRLHSIGRVKLFSPIKYRKQDYAKKDVCFGLDGNSNGVEFRVHALKSDKKILRVEVRLVKKDVICAYTDETNTFKQIKAMAKGSQNIIMDTFQYIVPRGDYYKLKQVRTLISNGIKDKILRNKMCRFLELLIKKKSVHLAQKEFGRDFKEVMAAFEALDLSPITLSKRCKAKKLDSLYKYFDI
jgi:hypothetical protein